MCFGGGSKRGRPDRQEVCPAQVTHSTHTQTHTKKHAPAHLFPLTGEERDGSLQDMPKGGGQVCVSVCETVNGKEAVDESEHLHQSLSLCLSAKAEV